LYPFVGTTEIYKCPTDPKTVTAGGKTLATVRSYSMNSFMGGRDDEPSTSAYVLFTRDSDIRQWDRTWVILDEDESTISDGWFPIDPTGHKWFDQRKPALSASRHNRSFPLCFADGHSEVWQHVTLQTSASPSSAGPADGADLQRLAAAATRPK
jgi:prepilin-type processing-associated H-X9-DG protein